MSETIVLCPGCNGRRRVDGHQCRLCKGSGRVYHSESEKLGTPTEDEPAIHMLAMVCPKCGEFPAPSQAARERRYKPSDFHAPIYCGKCKQERLSFVTEPAL